MGTARSGLPGISRRRDGPWHPTYLATRCTGGAEVGARRERASWAADAAMDRGVIRAITPSAVRCRIVGHRAARGAERNGHAHRAIEGPEGRARTGAGNAPPLIEGPRSAIEAEASLGRQPKPWGIVKM